MAPKRSVRILYMEDDAGLARLFQRHLQRSGYEVDLAPDGNAGLSLYRKGNYDILAVDYKMPQKDGLDVIRELAASPDRVPPTIMLTANGDEALAVEALKLGASDYIVKDTAGGYIRLLPSVIERLLENHRLQEAEHQAQEALRESEERLRQITASASDAIISYDQDGVILLWNRSAVEMLGFSEQKMLGRPLDELVPPAHEALYRSIHQQLRDGSRQVTEMEFLNEDARAVPVEASFSCSGAGQRPVFTCILRDITSRLKAQTAMEKAARHDATATLAKGMAHQFNNLLFGVLGNTELLQLRLEDRPDAIGRLEMIRQQGQRASDLVQQLLAFARRGQYQPVILDLNDTVRKALAAQESELQPKVAVEQRLAANLWRVSADPTQMTQVVTNLYRNALEALEGDGGRLRLSTENIQWSGAAAARPGLPQTDLSPGRYVLLSVTDDGCGMDEETLVKVFTPFFTTKFQGRGLGMAAVWGIVEHHGGLIHLDSVLGQGTTAQVYLPALDPEIRARPAVRGAYDLPRGTETVLIVDEEEVTRTVAAEFLEILGYRVLKAENGRQAVDLATSHPGPLHLTLLDLNLTQPAARWTLPALVAARPEIKILTSSGQQDEVLPADLALAGVTQTLQKPFGIEVLAFEVRQALDRP
jgi:PAS domain S-box-containing protein